MLQLLHIHLCDDIWLKSWIYCDASNISVTRLISKVHSIKGGLKGQSTILLTYLWSYRQFRICFSRFWNTSLRFCFCLHILGAHCIEKWSLSRYRSILLRIIHILIFFNRRVNEISNSIAHICSVALYCLACAGFIICHTIDKILYSTNDLLSNPKRKYHLNSPLFTCIFLCAQR